MALLVVYVSVAIGVSFMCSVLEAVLLSISPAYVGATRAERPALANRLDALKSDIDRPLAAILSLNTIAHTIGAAGAGAQATVVFGDAWIGVFSAVLTLAILVVSEIIPKTLGAVYWRTLAPMSARVLEVLILALYPLVILSQWLTRLIAPEKPHGISREELVALADIGAANGVVEGTEAEILRNLLRFDRVVAEDVMTPRTVLSGFPDDTPVQMVLDAQTTHSRLPTYEGDLDHVTGYVLKDDVLAELAAGRSDTPVSKLRRELLRVPRDTPLPRVFDALLRRRDHIALVEDTYGGTAGVVTMEDVIETLLGLEIMDEGDQAVDMQRLAREQWQARARKLGIEPPDPEG
jgi:CBS domain containing-hemolysin-like protein